MASITLKSFDELFSKDDLFRIPNYQRGFAWQATQVNDFWTDLINLHPDKTHYTGMITIQKLPKKEWSDWKDDVWFLERPNHRAYHVIDGQQRITTFILLINSIIKYAKNQGFEEICSIKLDGLYSKYICRTDGGLHAYVFGYEVDNPSFKYLKCKIFEDESPDSILQTYYTNNLEFAKTFFDNQLQEYCKGSQKRLDGLFFKLTTRLQFIEYDIKPDINVSVAFETMNNRGKKLSTLELLKNRLIYLVTLFDGDKKIEHEKAQLTRLINEKWSVVYKWLGANKNKPLDDDDFLRNHKILYFGYSRANANEYVTFLLKTYFTAASILNLRPVEESYPDQMGEIDNPDFEDEDGPESEQLSETSGAYSVSLEDIENYVNSLAITSEKWYYSFYPEQCAELEQDEIDAITRLNHLGIAYFRPLVVASYAIKASKDKRLELFESIERVILLIFRMGRAMSTYQSSVYYRLAFELFHSTTDIDTIIYRLNKLFIQDLVQNVKSFKAAITSESGEGFFHWNSLRFVLYEYEMSLYSREEIFRPKWEDFTSSSKDKISIEHIYPQSHDSGWVEFDECSPEERNRLMNSLGNLLLLGQPKNSSMQNNSFETKKIGTKNFTGYLKGSASEREVAEETIWGPEQIRDRGIRILEFIEKRWRITFKNREQMYDILSIPERYRQKIDEMDPSLKKQMLTEELIGDYKSMPSEEQDDIPIDKILEYAESRKMLFIKGVVFNDEFTEYSDIHAAVVNLLPKIINSDPSKLDDYCEIKEKYAWYPLFTKTEQKSNRYVDFGSVKIYLGGGRADLQTLQKVVQIYGLNPDSIRIRVKKRN